jgi:hypothetical protein
MGGWVGPRACLDSVDKIILFYPLGNGIPVVQSLVRRYTDRANQAQVKYIYSDNILYLMLPENTFVYESRRNNVSLNKDYISNYTLNIPTYDPTPNINIINNIREDSYIV